MAEERRRDRDHEHRTAENDREPLVPPLNARRDVERKVEREHVHREAGCPELVQAPGEDGPSADLHEILYVTAGRREGRKKSAHATPRTNPPTCAQKATPP